MSQIPEDGAEEDCGNESERVTDTVVVWAAPICPPLFPQTSSELFKEWL
jgi:hypothetical protein